MDNILNSYIPKFLVDINRANDDVLSVSTNYLSPEGDIYTLEKRTISPVLVQTTQSINELRPEISNAFPFSNVTPVEFDGSTLLLSPSVNSQPTSSQMYYVPIYFERFNKSVISNIDKTFYELTNIVPDTPELETETFVGGDTSTPDDVNTTIEQLQELINQLRTRSP